MVEQSTWNQWIFDGRSRAPIASDWATSTQEDGMSHFTQLGLSGEPDRKPTNQTARTNSGAAPGPGSRENQPGDRNNRSRRYSQGQKTATVICSLIAASLLGISLLETSGCSKASDKSASISAPPQMAPGPALPAPAASTQIAAPGSPTKTPTRKTRIQRTLIASSYTNPLYGVSFRYPKNYSLKEGDKANAEWTRLEPIAMNFVEPGGTTLTMVELPNRLYADTDLASAFFTVSVNTGLNRASCGQFASSNPGPARAEASGEKGDQAPPVAASPVATSRIEAAKTEPLDGPSTEVESSGDPGAKHADTKYYHVFENGICYEFALGFETNAADQAAGPIKAVDRSLVFRRLNWLLSTVKIEPAGVPDEATKAPITPVPLGKD
jgi:hypothetical protein